MKLGLLIWFAVGSSLAFPVSDQLRTNKVLPKRILEEADEDINCLNNCIFQCEEDCGCFSLCFTSVSSNCSSELVSEVQAWIDSGCTDNEDEIDDSYGDDKEEECLTPCLECGDDDCACFGACFANVSASCSADFASEVQEWIDSGCMDKEEEGDEENDEKPSDEPNIIDASTVEETNQDERCTAATGGPATGFDWGAGCASGNGCFMMSLPNSNAYQDVGMIPAGKFDVVVRLDAVNDLDITLFDVGDTSKFAEGTAVVAWCGTANCNKGVLGMAPGASSAVYEREGIAPMNIEYSGYNGDGGLGKEYIRISGEISTPLLMRAFSYAPGSARVTYSWGESQSSCCIGTGPCGGSFKQRIQRDAITVVGEIPVDKYNLQITLEADNDVDIQLYDLADVTTFREGNAIIAWCGVPGCNLGMMNGPSSQQMWYPSSTARDRLLYSWSGYNGQDQNPGHETISIDGATTRPLVMKVFGYASGEADVSYTYWNPPKTAVSRQHTTRRKSRSNL